MKNSTTWVKKMRVVVILPEDAYDAWLDAPVKGSMAMLQPYPAGRLVAQGMPKPTQQPLL